MMPLLSRLVSLGTVSPLGVSVLLLVCGAAWCGRRQVALPDRGQGAWCATGQDAWRGRRQVALPDTGNDAWCQTGQDAWRGRRQVALPGTGQGAWCQTGQDAWRGRRQASRCAPCDLAFASSSVAVPALMRNSLQNLKDKGLSLPGGLKGQGMAHCSSARAWGEGQQIAFGAR
eukprot:1161662-Pelagomonas_calceolata.AAC.7